MSMYPSLRENQGLAQEAIHSSSQTQPTDMNGQQPARTSPPYAPSSNHAPSSSRSRRPQSGLPDTQRYWNAAYYTRLQDGFHPSQLPAKYISHLYYAFATFDYEGTVKLIDEDADTKSLQSCLDLRLINQEMRVLLSVGGPGNSDMFRHVAASEKSRRQFAYTVKSLITRFNLDGLDINWQSPSDATDGQHLVELMIVLRAWLPRNEHFLLSVALPGVVQALDTRFVQIDQISIAADMINVMTYDLVEGQQSAHHAALLTRTLPNIPAQTHSCQAAVDYLYTQGCQMNKVLLGIACYGQAFRGTTAIGQPCTESRKIPYKDIQPVGVHTQVDQGIVAAHCIDGDYWISFDNQETVYVKGQYARMQRLKGLSFSAAAYDSLETRSCLMLAGREGLGR